jgi:hypothetical protein
MTAHFVRIFLDAHDSRQFISGSLWRCVVAFGYRLRRAACEPAAATRPAAVISCAARRGFGGSVANVSVLRRIRDLDAHLEWVESAAQKPELDKLCRAPWQLLRHEAGTNAASNLLRRFWTMSWRKSRTGSRLRDNQSGAIAWAFVWTKPARRCGKNLAAVLESLTGIRGPGTAGSPRLDLEKASRAEPD